MTSFVVRSLSIEVEHPEGSATIVVRDPYGDARRSYVAGDLPEEVVGRVLTELGVSERQKVLAVVRNDAGSRPGISRPTRPSPSQPSGSLASTPILPVTSASAPSSARPSALRSPAELASLIEQLTHAVVRAGRLHPTSTVDDLLEQAWTTAGSHPVFARLLARLEDALAPEIPAAEAALALAALSSLVERLRSPHDPLHGELSGRPLAQAMDPCELLELGRRRERPFGAETRLMMDLSSGELVAETLFRPGARLSRGPVGRHVSLTLGRRLLAEGRAFIEIQQYEYDPAPSQEQLERASNLSEARPPVISNTGLELVTAPLPLSLQVRSINPTGRRVVSLAGTDLDLRDGSCPGACDALFGLLARGVQVEALIGTLELFAWSTAQGALCFVPWSALTLGSNGRDVYALSF